MAGRDVSLPKEQGPNSADEEIPQRPLVGMDTNLSVIVSKKALQSTGDTDCVDVMAGRGRGRGRGRRRGRGRGKTETVSVEDFHSLQAAGYIDCVDIEAGRRRGRGKGRGRGRPQ